MRKKYFKHNFIVNDIISEYRAFSLHT